MKVTVRTKHKMDTLENQKNTTLFTIRGWPALAVLTLIVSVCLWRSITTCTTVDPEVAAHLRNILAIEYATPLLLTTMRNLSEHDEVNPEDNMKSLTTYKKSITFPALTSKGGGSRIIVRAEILVDGQPPLTGKSVRYFQFNYSALLGYTYDMEVGLLHYHLPFMD